MFENEKGFTHYSAFATYSSIYKMQTVSPQEVISLHFPSVDLTSYFIKYKQLIPKKKYYAQLTLTKYRQLITNNNVCIQFLLVNRM